MSDESKPPENNEPEEHRPEENEPEEHRPKVLSLNRELSAVALAVRGAQIMTDLDVAGGYLDEEAEEDSPQCVASMLAIVTARLDLVGRVIRREVNPALLWGPHNAVGEHESRVEGDVLLTEWSHA
jgi:hypothetical protein